MKLWGGIWPLLVQPAYVRDNLGVGEETLIFVVDCSGGTGFVGLERGGDEVYQHLVSASRKQGLRVEVLGPQRRASLHGLGLFTCGGLSKNITVW